MSTTRFDLDHDLNIAEYMVRAMERYVHPEPLYSYVGAHVPLMTLGGFLLRLRRLKMFRDSLSSRQLDTLRTINTIHTDVLEEWHVHYGGKLLNEASSRLDMIQYYLSECTESVLTCQDGYHLEAMRRTMAQELLDEAERLQVIGRGTVTQQLIEVDSRLRPLLDKTTFLWDKRLQLVYPEPVFWWLYGQPTQERIKMV